MLYLHWKKQWHGCQIHQGTSGADVLDNANAESMTALF
jgi:hypothetical protein